MPRISGVHVNRKQTKNIVTLPVSATGNISEITFNNLAANRRFKMTFFFFGTHSDTLAGRKRYQIAPQLNGAGFGLLIQKQVNSNSAPVEMSMSSSGVLEFTTSVSSTLTFNVTDLTACQITGGRIDLEDITDVITTTEWT